METEFIPKFSNRESKIKALTLIIETSIREKLLKYLDEMSLEDKEDNDYIPMDPDIPKTKKGIEKAIDKFIADFNPVEDKADELLMYLGFFDIGEDIEPGVWTDRGLALRKVVRYKEEGDSITILSPPKEVIEKVREYLLSLSPEELKDLLVFGIIVTEEEVKRDKGFWVDINARNTGFFLEYFAMWNYGKIMWKEEPEDKDGISYSAKKVYEIFRKAYSMDPENTRDPEELKDYKERATKAVEDYPKEAQAYCRGFVMLQNNFSEGAIMATVKAILK